MQTRNTYSKTCFFLVTLFQFFHFFVFFFLSVLPLLFFIFLNVILVSFLFFFMFHTSRVLGWGECRRHLQHRTFRCTSTRDNARTHLNLSFSPSIKDPKLFNKITLPNSSVWRKCGWGHTVPFCWEFPLFLPSFCRHKDVLCLSEWFHYYCASRLCRDNLIIRSKMSKKSSCSYYGKALWQKVDKLCQAGTPFSWQPHLSLNFVWELLACVAMVKTWLQPIFTIDSHRVGQLEDHGWSYWMALHN